MHDDGWINACSSCLTPITSEQVCCDDGNRFNEVLGVTEHIDPICTQCCEHKTNPSKFIRANRYMRQP